MDEQEEKLLLYGATAVGIYVFVAEPILKKLGVDPADTAVVQQQNNTDPAQNAFSLQFQPFQDYIATQSDGLPSLAQGLKQQYDALDSIPPIDPDGGAINVAIAAEAVWSAFNILKGTNHTGLVSLFNNINNKEFVAAMDGYLFYNYGVGLLPLLQKGRFSIGPLNWGLNDTDMAAIINHINSLQNTPNG